MSDCIVFALTNGEDDMSHLTKNNILSFKGKCQELEMTLEQLHMHVMTRQNRSGLPKIFWTMPASGEFEAEEYRMILPQWGGQRAGQFTVEGWLNGSKSHQLNGNWYLPNTTLKKVIADIAGFSGEKQFDELFFGDK